MSPKEVRLASWAAWPNRLTRRVWFAATTAPTVTQWLELVLLGLIFTLIAVPVATGAGFITPNWRLTPGQLAPLALRVLFLPALIEELLFRVLPNPYPGGIASVAARWQAGILSLAAYVLVHPLAAQFRPLAASTFTDPAFLGLAALLGLFCLIAYARSGSLWSPVLLHWGVVIGWLGLGGLDSLGALPGP